MCIRVTFSSTNLKLLSLDNGWKKSLCTRTNVWVNPHGPESFLCYFQPVSQYRDSSFCQRLTYSIIFEALRQEWIEFFTCWMVPESIVPNIWIGHNIPEANLRGNYTPKTKGTQECFKNFKKCSSSNVICIRAVAFQALDKYCFTNLLADWARH